MGEGRKRRGGGGEYVKGEGECGVGGKEKERGV